MRLQLAFEPLAELDSFGAFRAVYSRQPLCLELKWTRLIECLRQAESAHVFQGGALFCEHMVCPRARFELPSKGLKCLAIDAQGQQVGRVPAKVAQVCVDDVHYGLLRKVPFLEVKFFQGRSVQVDSYEDLEEVQVGALVIKSAHFEALQALTVEELTKLVSCLRAAPLAEPEDHLFNARGL